MIAIAQSRPMFFFFSVTKKTNRISLDESDRAAAHKSGAQQCFIEATSDLPELQCLSMLFQHAIIEEASCMEGSWVKFK
jgi:hypothetical protein